MNKRAIAILGAIFILIVATLGFLIYQRSKSNNSNTNADTNTETNTQTNTPPIEETPTTPTEPTSTSGAVRLTDTDDSIISPILFYQGNGISYFNSKGQLFQTDLQDGNGIALLSNKRELSISLKSNITKILWPLAGNSFMAEFNSTSSRPTWSLYDSSKAVYIDIPPQVYSLDWMPTGDKIVFTYVDSAGKTTMNISNPDTTGYQELAQMYEADNVIKIAPDGKHILFYRTQGTDTTKNIINMVTIDGKTFTTVVKDGYNSGVLWSPDSTKFLYTKRDPGTQKFVLWVANVATGQTFSLGVATTTSKATWSKDGSTVYAGVPTTGTAGQGLTQDSIYKIDLASGNQTQLETGLAVDAQNLFLNSSENILFFKNGQDNALYFVPIK